MRRARRAACGLVSAGCLGAIGAVAWHSVEEVHYLKGFYPERLTVEEAFWAAAVEAIKVGLIAFPLLLILGLALWVGWGRRDRNGEEQ